MDSSAIWWIPGIAIVIAGLAIGTIACQPASSAGDPTATPEATATPTPEPSPPPGTTALEELIGLIPDTPNTRAQLQIIDHAAITEALDSDEAQQWSWRRTFISFRETIALMTPILNEHLVFEPQDVDQSVLAGSPPEQLEVLRGRFNPEATDAAMSACSGECIPPDAREEYQGVTFYSWRGDSQGNLRERLRPPAFDKGGRGGRIAVQDEYMFRALWTDGMKSLIDASLGQRPSLRDVEEFRLLAAGLAGLGAFWVFLSDQTQSVADLDSYTVALSGEPGTCSWLIADDETRRTYKVVHWDSRGSSVGVQADSPLDEAQQLRQEWQQSPLRPYLAVGTGRGMDSQGRYLAVVLVHADEELAQENVGLRRRRVEDLRRISRDRLWRETVDVERMEIRAEGRVLLARLPLIDQEGISAFWPVLSVSNSGFPPDPLLLHE